MVPSKGHLQPTWVKALIIDGGDGQICFVTLDAIGMVCGLASFVKPPVLFSKIYILFSTL